MCFFQVAIERTGYTAAVKWRSGNAAGQHTVFPKKKALWIRYRLCRPAPGSPPFRGGSPCRWSSGRPNKTHSGGATSLHSSPASKRPSCALRCKSSWHWGRCLPQTDCWGQIRSAILPSLPICLRRQRSECRFSSGAWPMLLRIEEPEWNRQRHHADPVKPLTAEHKIVLEYLALHGLYAVRCQGNVNTSARTV